MRTRQLMAVVIILGLVACWGLFITSEERERGNQIANQTQALERSAALLSTRLEGLLTMNRSALGFLTTWIGLHPEENPLQDPQFMALAQNFTDMNGQPVDLRLVDEEGGLFYVKRPTRQALANVADRDYFRVQLEEPPRGFYVAAPVKSRVTQLWGLPFSVPAPPNAGKLRVLFVALELPLLEPVLRSHAHTRDTSVSLIRDDGLFLTRYPFVEELEGTYVSKVAEWQEAMARSPEGGIVRYRATLVGGQHKTLAYVRMGDFPLYVLVARNTEQLDEGWRAYFGVRVALMLLFTALMLGAAAGLFLFTFKLQGIRRQLEEVARTDSLTGLLNRRAFFERASTELGRARRTGEPLSLVALDLDHFKAINDTMGHQFGDMVLVTFSACLRTSLRTIDVVARMGGEEFVALLPNTGHDRALDVAERIRLAVEDCQPGGHRITVSLGVAALEDGESLEAVSKAADEALYEAKSAGRNCVRHRIPTPG